ncbi:MAG TPA: RNA polymerase sigma factor [Polyangiales bacterium]|nr:RNA polymerase sigma factor [Polyangiales bacterium]
MVDSSDKPLSGLTETVQSSWHRFLDVYEPLRPELYRYCRYLTRTPWDAEDLVQDTLARAFVTLGNLYSEPPNPRAWMFRVASNLWIDRVRRARELLGVPLDRAVAPAPLVDRAAASTLIGSLAPRERAAVVLKDVFGLSLEEVAEALSTSAGAVKAALHRGRGKLQEPEADALQPVAAPVLDAFCEAFNARDLARLTALLLDTSVVEVVGAATEYGPDAARDPETGSFAGFLSSIARADRGGVDARYLQGYIAQAPRVELREHRGELIFVFWYAHEDGEAVRALARVETEGDQIVRLRYYFFTEDVLAEVCGELAVPFRRNGYRFW